MFLSAPHVKYTSDYTKIRQCVLSYLSSVSYRGSSQWQDHHPWSWVTVIGGWLWCKTPEPQTVITPSSLMLLPHSKLTLSPLMVCLISLQSFAWCCCHQAPLPSGESGDWLLIATSLSSFARVKVKVAHDRDTFMHVHCSSTGLCQEIRHLGLFLLYISIKHIVAQCLDLQYSPNNVPRCEMPALLDYTVRNKRGMLCNHVVSSVLV